MSKYILCSKAFDIVGDTVELYYSEHQAIKENLEKEGTDKIKEVIFGKWIHYPECGVTKCSACNWSIEEAWSSKYCPHCGAKMEG